MNPPPAPPSPRVQSGSAQIAFEGVGDPILAIAAAARDIDPSVYAPAETKPEPAIVPVIRDTPQPAGAVYLQLGAFGSRENAEGFLTRAKVQFDWLADRLQVREREGLYRVHVGPYANPGEARQAAERIALALGVRPVVTP
jgi:rare lipoprotein A